MVGTAMWQRAAEARRSLLVVISGPSGSGKNTLMEGFLAANPDFVDSVSATTRAPRPGEVDGRDYHFLDQATFEQWIAEERFLEYAQVFGRDWYGTPKSFVEECFAVNKSVIMDIDVQGAAQIRKCWTRGLVTVFVIPPDRDELRRRLVGRGTEDRDAVERRLGRAEAEIVEWSSYDYLIVNDDIERARGELQAIVTAERRRVGRQQV